MRLWGTRVLIFDDDEALVREAAAVLQREGGSVVHVSGAHEALATIIGVMPDALVVAVDRPALDAGRLMRLVRTLSPEKGGRIPAVSLSALPPLDADRRGQCDSVHFQAHLLRPLDPDQFLAVAAGLCGEWVERRLGQRERRHWPEEVRLERRREVRAPRPPDMRAALRNWRGRGES
jgi:CheY-like chemotaxis protein